LGDPLVLDFGVLAAGPRWRCLAIVRRVDDGQIAAQFEDLPADAADALVDASIGADRDR
jgi:hypothetical protein